MMYHSSRLGFRGEGFRGEEEIFGGEERWGDCYLSRDFCSKRNLRFLLCSNYVS